MPEPHDAVDQNTLDRALEAINSRITRQIETQERERAETAEHLKDLIANVHEAQDVSLREYVEAVLRESTRALEMAEREREKAAIALREHTQKAIDKADSEREKAASVLRDDLASAISQGDTNLLNHIRQEIERIREALTAADTLELSRVHQVEELARSVQRELTLVQEAAKEAIAKAEASTEKRFESVNELRAQMGDLISSHQTSINTLTEKLLLREVADAQFAEINKKVALLQRDVEARLPREVFDRTVIELTTWRSMVDKRLAEEAGKAKGVGERRASTATDTQLVIARGGLFVAVIGLVVTVVLAANGQI